VPEAGQARIAFAGTPEFARIVLDALIHAQIRPVLVLTQPDRPAGRRRQLQASPVKRLASVHNLPLAQPASLRVAEAQAMLAANRLDLMVVAAYGLILPRSVLAIPARGCVNVHASVLPRWRGAAPIERALMAGDAATGVTLMQMEAGLDTGPVIADEHYIIQPDETGAELERRLGDLGGSLLLQWLPELLAGRAVARAQDHSSATYAAKLTRADAQIDWRRSAQQIALQVRALVGRQSAEAHIGAEHMQILRAAPSATTADTQPGRIIAASAAGIAVQCGTGSLLIHELRITSRGKGTAISAAAACNGFAGVFTPGAVFDVAA